jgi:acetate kinase
LRFVCAIIQALLKTQRLDLLDQMKVLAINCGSSTLKFHLFDVVTRSARRGRQQRLAHGIVDGIGERGAIDFAVEGGQRIREEVKVSDHGDAIEKVLDWLKAQSFLGSDGVEVVGHRVVHGGDRFVEPTIIDDEVISAVEAVSILAPLHNEPSLRAIKAARETLGSSIPMVAVFDTAFHHTLPERAWRYAIPQKLAAKHHIRRYGFHGLAHRYMVERYADMTSTPLSQVNLVTLQLGNGCSAAAVKGGCSVDTSMGFTPLEGLMMGTRCGDIDPSVVSYLSRVERVDVQEVEHWLNTQSGLLGVSGRSRDMRELLEAEQAGDTHAGLAIDMFCYRVRKYIGAYLAARGGADAVLFGGGIGENAPPIRARICDDMEWCGLILDQGRNDAAVGIEKRISAEGAGVQAYVIPVDESLIIARDTVSCLRQHR